MSCELPDSSDVTLAMNNTQAISPVCKFNKFGHCKFAETCRHLHINIICTNPHCIRKLCSSRHPNPRKYFISTGFCKFEEDCSYLHPVPVVTVQPTVKLEQEIMEIKEILKTVHEILAVKEIEIKLLCEKVLVLEETSSLKLMKSFKCEKCE